MCQPIKRILLAFAAVLACTAVSAQVTTSGLSGQIADEAGEPLPGAAVIAVHNPTGTQYYAITNNDGMYTIQGMRAGGPYSVEVSYVGMATLKYDDITLRLGESYLLDSKMKSVSELDAVTVVAEKSFNASITGAGSAFSLSQVQNMPTIDRSIYDVVKYTPQASINKTGGISFTGSNNRYNSFQIDGAVANDTFGLAASGTNGGQTGANPISIDAIESIQVVIAPFDVRQSGFTGGSINAITKSGTNEFKGSFYTSLYNQDLIGTTPGVMAEGKTREKYDTELSEVYGFTVGGPIIKNKLFFFASAEYDYKSYPNVYSPANGTYEVDGKELNAPVILNGVTHDYFDTEVADAILEHYQKTYSPASNFSESYSEHQTTTRSFNVLGRLDWNINDNNKLMLRYQYMDAYDDKYGSGNWTYYFNNSAYKMADKTNTVVAELNTRINDAMSNELRLTGVFVRDHREYPYKGANIYIKDNVTIDLGTDYSSGANSMNSDTYTITDNFSWYVGKHNITFGTHNEIFKFNNLFLQYAFGGYTFSSIADYLNDKLYEFNYRYADPEYTGGESIWAANTYAAEFGLYAQDEWKPNRNLTLTYGLRVDVAALLNKPTENADYNATDFATKNDQYVGATPKATPLFSPRIGFRYYFDDSHRSLLRGGVGLFTGRVPFVWLSNAYNNTGIEAKSVKNNNTKAEKGVTVSDIPFTSDPYNDIIKAGVVSAANSGATINTLSKNFKYPQVLRANLGFDQEFDGNLKFTFDALFSKTLNNVYFSNLAIASDNKVVYAVNSESGPTAPYYSTLSSAYSTIVALMNTNKGYTYSLSGKVEKSFDWGLNLMASYTYGHSYSVNDGTSSVALSNWKYNYSVDSNSPDELSYALFDKPHKINVVASYTTPTYLGGLSTNITLTYSGESGMRYTYTMNESADFNGDGVTGNSCMYIPTEKEVGMMNWKNGADAAKFENFIRQDSYLRTHRGQWSQRYAGIAPFENHFDLHIAENVWYDKANNRKFEITADILNFSNLLNREWGMYYSSAYNRQILAVNSLTEDENGNMTPNYSFKGNSLSTSDFYSRWRCQIGFRLTF